MSKHPTQNKTRNILLSLFFLSFTTFIFAQDSAKIVSGNKGNINTKRKASLKQVNNLTELQQEARDYRVQGYQLQRAGELDGALSLYQKASVLDPTYAEVFNDLGIIYEAQGDIDRAEESYLRCITIDPKFVSAYTNLALLYESVRGLDKAAFYWQKRAEFGAPDDPWTKKAKQRLNDIRLVLSDKPFEEAREQDIVGLLQDVSCQKNAQKKDNKALAKTYFGKAKVNYKKGDEVTALKLAIDAAQLDPNNREIQEFVDKLQIRILSK